MERLSHWLAWSTIAAIVVFAGLNWSLLSTSAPVDLGLARIDAPFGVVLLGMTAVFAALFVLSTLVSRVRSLLETRRLLMELRQAREQAARARDTAIDDLRQLVSTEFRKLDERLSKALAARAEPRGQTRADQRGEAREELPLVKLP